jgi:beta-lactamase regulating signal transducer with metallopeptidase domain
MESSSQIDHDTYRESILKVELSDMNMKQLCELLDELNKNKRINTKELEITKSKTAKRSINVALTIATLEPRSA